MAQINVQGPSEDEEFDTANNNVAVATDEPKPTESETLSSEDTSEAEATAAPTFTEEPATEEVEAPAEDAKPEAKPASPASTPADIPPPVTPVRKDTSKPHADLWRLLLELILLLALVGLGLWAWSLHSDNQNLQKQVTTLNNNPLLVAERTRNSLVQKVGKLMELPTNAGTPVVYTVSDVSKAKAQTDFFANSQNGDQVLIYQTGFAVVYRPSTNKIVNSGVVTVKSQAAATPTTSPKATTPTTKR
jgi:hypothetical protein